MARAKDKKSTELAQMLEEAIIGRLVPAGNRAQCPTCATVYSDSDFDEPLVAGDIIQCIECGEQFELLQEFVLLDQEVYDEDETPG